MDDRQLPSNIDAEKGILGSILIDPEAIALVADILRPGHFYRNAHRTIYEAMVDLANRREPADFITLCDELECKDKLEEVDGSGYLVSLIKEVPTSANIEYYAGIVKRTYEFRRLIHAAGKIAAAAYDQDPEALTIAERLIFEIGQRSTAQGFSAMPDMVNDYMAELAYLHSHRGTMTGIPSGYTDIDNMTSGLQKTDVIIVGGRPSSGKTAFGLSIGLNAALSGHKIAIFSLEMGRQSLMRRLVAMKSRVDMQRLRAGWIEDHEWEAIENAASGLSGLPIFINDTAGNPVASMRSQLKRLVQEQGRIDMVIVDYLGLVGSDGNKSENRVQEVSKISRDLKALAREFDIPFIVLAQLSRAVESRSNKRPLLSDLRDSGAVEQDADVIMFLYREAYYAQQEGREVEPGKERIAEVIISKQRNGPVGDVLLYFYPEHGMFYNLDTTDDERSALHDIRA